MRKALGTFTAGKIAVAAVFILTHTWLVFVKTRDTMEINARPNTVPSPHITGDTEIGQLFVAPSDGLSRIDVMLGTHNRINDREVIFRLWDLRPERILVAEIAFNAADAPNNLYKTFGFPPVAGSGGRTYAFALSSPDSTVENALSAWMNEADVYPQGQALLNGRPLSGDLTFRTYAARTPAREWSRILARVPGLSGGRGAVVMIASFLLFEAVQAAFLLMLLGGFGMRRSRGGFDPEVVRA